MTTNKIYEQVEQVRLDLKNSIDIKAKSKTQEDRKGKKKNSED